MICVVCGEETKSLMKNIPVCKLCRQTVTKQRDDARSGLKTAAKDAKETGKQIQVDGTNIDMFLSSSLKSAINFLRHRRQANETKTESTDTSST